MNSSANLRAGAKCDFREPNVIRAAPTPLCNTFHEVWGSLRFCKIINEEADFRSHI
jgi:kynureninase